MLVHDQVTAIERALDGGHPSEHFTVFLPDLATDQIVPVERSGRQRLEFDFPQPQLGTREGFRFVHRGDSGKSHDRTPLMEPDLLDLRLARVTGIADEHPLPDSEPLLHEIRFRIHDDVAPDAMGTRHAANEQQPVGRIRTHIVTYWSSRNSSVALAPSSSAVALTSVRIAAAVRPWRPITRPSSPGAMNSSTSVCPLCCRSVTRTASGRSASALATTSTTSRQRLTMLAAPSLVRPPAASVPRASAPCPMEPHRP